jgi:hypothetical protein
VDRSVRFVIPAALVMLSVVMSRPAVSADALPGPRPLVIDWGRPVATPPREKVATTPANGSTYEQDEQTGDEPQADAPPRPLTRAERVRLLRAAESAETLARSSGDAFHRGLMPLPDHLEQLSLAGRIEHDVARLSGSPDAQLDVLLRQVERYRGIVAHLERFTAANGPIAAADMHLARALLARTEAALDGAARRPAQAILSASHGDVAAELQVDRRTFDERLGLSTPEAVLDARLQQGVAPALDTKSPPDVPPRALADYRDGLAALAARVEVWGRLGAGIGRADRLQNLRIHQAAIDRELAEAALDPAAMEVALSRAVEDSETLHETLSGFHRTGTATLFDLASAWRLRSDLIASRPASEPNSISEPASETPPPGVAALEQDYEAIARLAAGQRDLRGRHAADVKYIRGLADVTELRALANRK